MRIKSFTYGFGSALMCLALGFMTQMACARIETGTGLKSNGNAEEEVRAVLREAADNEMKRDRAVAERLMADDFIRTGPDGAVWNRAQTIAHFPQSEGSTLQSVEFKDERIRIYGDTAVVTGLGVAQGKTGAGADFVVNNRCTFVLVKRDGRWQAVVIQQTRAQM